MGKGKKSVSSSSSSGNGGRHDAHMELDPRTIRFTHSKIRPVFSGCGRKVEDTLNDLVTGAMTVPDLPLITVLPINGEYYSLNNRRLYVLKECCARGLLESSGNVVRVRLKQAAPKEVARYTPARCSLVATVMRVRPGEEEQGEGGGDADGNYVDDAEGDDNDA